jgi:hypothetical protein
MFEPAEHVEEQLRSRQNIAGEEVRSVTSCLLATHNEALISAEQHALPLQVMPMTNAAHIQLRACRHVFTSS